MNGKKKHIIAGLLLWCMALPVFAVDTIPARRPVVYVIELMQEINAPGARIVRKGLQAATEAGADYVLLHLNTYGGELPAADSIRNALLHFPVPVIVFIDNQAASAGALIAIACDSIYMRSGGSIGAATVVHQTGEAAPDKYQSFMRSMMRATAEAQGRDPRIAEAMVDPRTAVPNVSDSGKVLTFTVDEAIKHRYCEGKAENITDVLQQARISNYELLTYRSTTLDHIIHFLLNPFLQGLFLMLIIGGIYFELQSPGIGFPLIAATAAALLYFAPLYLEGLLQNWELLVFILGILLILLEIFIIPGFGITGISGILLCVTGLIFAMVDNSLFKTPEGLNLAVLVRPMATLSIAVFCGLTGSIYLTRRLYSTRMFGRIALRTGLTGDEGYVGVATAPALTIGSEGVAQTALRPSGKVEINGEIYDAVAEYGMIGKGDTVRVTRYETGQIYCVKK
ncbi:MAG: ATP-dependent Clp protease proteolytic subunit [Prevotellaceae bacterium]|jgi:membrane-bound serine protease (ClpP class)|nr:ATP-dependent Clp protease proteolytic subunit [Prevotellaceae bacterium]